MECVIANDWTLEEKTLRDVAGEGHLVSKVIQTTIPGVEYCIRIYPNNDNSVYIELCVKTNTVVDAEFTFTIPSANFSQTLTYSFEYDDNEHGEHAIERDSFFDPANRYFRNRKLTLQLRGTLKCAENNVIESGNNIGEILWKREDKDFTIEVDGKKIMAHKFILRERSPYFAAMFDSGMKESIENKVIIEGFPFKVVEIAIKICYDCTPSCICVLGSQLRLLKFSDAYDIAHVKIYIEKELSMCLNSNNVCRIANSSCEFNANNLRLCCINYLIKCLKDSTPIAGFDSLDAAFKSELLNKAFCHKI